MQVFTETLDNNDEVFFEASGTHLLLTLKNCAPDILNNESKLRELTREAAESTGAQVLEICSHRFSPQGVTTVAVLAESHASLHTYPESNTVFWDCFTCGTTCNPELSLDVLKKALNPEHISRQVIARS
jgi:S-adenosylmethionine decarboxylase proenzyme